MSLFLKSTARMGKHFQWQFHHPKWQLHHSKRNDQHWPCIATAAVPITKIQVWARDVDEQHQNQKGVFEAAMGSPGTGLRTHKQAVRSHDYRKVPWTRSESSKKSEPKNFEQTVELFHNTKNF
uniref:Uncharacterized protein n=1 Tax=Romanomermis culicivorax TaxID=13658 RepID=A0A915LA69_ROMCU